MYNNLADLLKEKRTSQRGIIFIAADNLESFVSYDDLYQEACGILKSLRDSGVHPGDELILQVDDPKKFIFVFWACILGGIIPVPVSIGNNDEHKEKIFKIRQRLNKPHIIAQSIIIGRLEEYAACNDKSAQMAKIKETAIFLDDLNYGKGEDSPAPADVHECAACQPKPRDIAFIQFSSGSTGEPKGVVLTHENLLTNIHAILEGIHCTDLDSSLSWMPLTHDMGLIGFHLSPLAAGINQYIMPTELFIRRPALWLKKAFEHKITVLSSPNFGYKYFLAGFKPEIAEGWDLSNIRLIFNGAEPIAADLCREFLNAMAPYKLRSNVIFPVYGLAEASLAVSFAPVGEEVVSITLDRNSLAVGAEVKTTEIEEDRVSFVDLGYPVSDCRVKICDEDGLPLSGQKVGCVYIQGKNVTAGYYNDQEATAKVITGDGWLNTGDLGFMREGRLVITGRAKDIIFVNGQNYYPHDIERVAEKTGRVELGDIAACGIFNQNLQRDEIYLFVLYKKSPESFIPLHMELTRHINLQMGLTVKNVLPVRKMPKTTSGKIQRFKLAQMYENGEFNPVETRINGLITEQSAARQVAGPENAIQEKLLSLWREILEVDKIDIHDNFFESGGNSLKAAALASGIHKEFNVRIQIGDLFNHQTVRDMAELIQNSAQDLYTAIPPVARSEYYQVSPAQKRLVVLSRKDEESIVYNIPAVLRLEGRLDKGRLEEVLKELVLRHEAFRTSFESINGEPVQKIHPDVDFHPCYQELELRPGVEEEQIREMIRQFVRPFDLGAAPLFRATLTRLHETEHILMIDMHHAISDGASTDVLIKEFTALYKGEKLPEPGIQYKDYAVWLNRAIGGGTRREEAFRKQEDYWLGVFAGELPVLNLPTDFPRPSRQSLAGDIIRFELIGQLTDKLRNLALKNGVTLNILLLTIYNILLSRYSGQEDIVVGLPVAARRHPNLAQAIGMFVNTLAIRNYPRPDMPFTGFLADVRTNLLQAYENQEYPFEELVEKVAQGRDLSRNPVFDTMFVLQNYGREEVAVIDGLKISSIPFDSGVSKFDITVVASENSSGVRLTIEYCARLFHKETMERFAEHFANIAGEVTSRPNLPLSEIRMLAEEELKTLIVKFNDTVTLYPKDKTIQELFEEQAAMRGERTALVFEDQEISYRELDRKANQLARWLRRKGIRGDSMVGLIVAPSPEMIIGIMGILKAGGAYVPVDPEYPEERILAILQDSEPPITLTGPGIHLPVTTGTGTEIASLNELLASLEGEDESDLNLINSPASLAYVMYTSGSTGKPKGNLTMHYNITRVVRDTNYIDISSDDNLLQLSNYAFDGSTFDIFGALLNGAKLVLTNKQTRLDVAKLARLIKNEGITVFFVTTALFNTLVEIDLDALARVRKILFGGERASVEHVRRALQYLGPDRIIHVYGPTESTVFATFHPVNHLAPKANAVPIGIPVANTRVYILDKYNRIQPVGIAGELCIGGDGLARGYLNRPEMTAEKFTPDPFVNAVEDMPSGSNFTLSTMYRTGDLVRLLPGGAIEFLDRMDTQVKLRGFRIELGEIEACLLKNAEIRETIVVARDDTRGGKYLCAYFVAGTRLAVSDLKQELARELPIYMIPAHFFQLDKMPLNINGKVDQKALPLPEDNFTGAGEYIPPANDTEAGLAKLWEEILGIPQAGVTDNFFELGGHSLKVTVLASRIHKTFNVEIPLSAIFEKQTIRELAALIDAAGAKAYKPIPPVAAGQDEAEEAYYAISCAQKRLFVQEQFEGIGASYNVPLAMTIDGKVDVRRLESSLRQLIDRHEPLRTSFQVKDGEMAQAVRRGFVWAMDYYDWTGSPHDLNSPQTSSWPQVAVAGETGDIYHSLPALRARIDEFIKDFVRPFNLDNAPLFRAALIKLMEDRYLFILDLHHIIADGISIGILLRDFAGLYKGRSLPPLKIQYKDYASWQNELLEGGFIKRQAEYWMDLFKDDVPVLNMPLDFGRKDRRNFDGSAYEFIISPERVQRINQWMHRENSTLNAFFMAVYAVLLSKYCQQEDLTIGSLVAGRSHPDAEELVGMFNNFLPVRFRLNPGVSFKQFMSETKAALISAYENQDYPYDKMVADIHQKADRSRNPLFDTMLIFHNQLEAGAANLDALFQISDLFFAWYPIPTSTSKLDFKLDIYPEKDDWLRLALEYNTTLFKGETISKMAEHLQNIMDEVIENPEKSIASIDILSETEKRRILSEFNNTGAEYPKTTAIHRMFEEQAAKAPDDIAVIYEDTRLTYGELNGKANSLAKVLRGEGIGRGDIVALFVERSPEMGIAVMATVKAGGAYLPVSPDYPDDRVRYMLEDSGAKILLTQERFRERCAPYGLKVIILEDGRLYEKGGANLDTVTKPGDLAYVIYTSGSTGKPKGALIEHYSLVNRLWWMQKKYPIGPGDVILQKTPYTFDVSVWELFWWSFTGAAVVFLTPGGEKDPGAILKAIEKYRVTTMHFVPSMLSAFLEYLEASPDTERLKSLRQVFASGEALQPQQVRRFNRLLNGRYGARLHNLYGPTEATVDVSYFDCSTGEDFPIIPIGKPIDNIRLYILDKHGKAAPVGVPGELHIAGDGLARGYLNRPELTAEKFVPNPFDTISEMAPQGAPLQSFPDKHPESGVLFHTSNFKLQTLYRTGDLTRWLPDGNVEYLGRIDHQVKIRGFRIELGEIESELLKHENIQEAVVIVREDTAGNKYLCAYIVPGDRQELITQELRVFLSQSLPDYMVPSFFILLEKMPLSANGKLDRKALPEPDGGLNTDAFYVEPVTAIEKELAGIWQEVLGVERRIGITDNFFELGGHSLKAVNLSLKINMKYNVELPLKEIFNYPTLKEMAGRLENVAQKEFTAILPSPEMEYYPLSSAQKRLFILNRIEGDNTVYNLPAVMKIDGKPDRSRFELALRELIKRHESLRTSFRMVAGEPVQIIHNQVEFTLTCRKDDESRIDDVVKEFILPFDLGIEPLFRAQLVEISDDRYYFMIDMHHIISDGVSTVILMNEFLQTYHGNNLSGLRLTYKDFVLWQNALLDSAALKKQEEYWLKEFAGEIPVLNLPTDFTRPTIQSFDGAKISYSLNQNLAGALRRTARENEATLYMVLLAAYNILLHKYAGQEELIVGSPTAGRQHGDLENLVGMFVNTLALKNYPTGEMTFKNFLREVKNNTLSAFENQDYQFEKLVEKLAIKKDLSRNPLFSVMFVLQNMGVPELEIEGLKFTPYEYQSNVSKFDLLLEVVELEGATRFNIEYCTRLFTEETINGIAEHFKQILTGIVADPEVLIRDISMLSGEEKSRILSDFNNMQCAYPATKTIHGLFEEQAAKTPDHIAVTFEDQRLTYAELNEKANQLAVVLRKAGIGRENIVGIMAERSMEMVAGLLAILKSGGAYLPINPDYPWERVLYMLQDSGSPLLLTQKHLADALAGYQSAEGDPGGESDHTRRNLLIVCLDDEGIYQGDGSNPDPVNDPADMAYIIYTSGTTGKPKGAVIEHRNVVRLLYNDKFQFDFRENDVWTMFHSFGFDFSVWEMYGALLYGGRLVVVSKSCSLNPGEFLTVLKRERVTVLNQVPSSFYNLIHEEMLFPEKELAVRYVIFGGEALKPSMLAPWRDKYPDTRLINMYGITETTVHVTFKEITDTEIGLNISNIGRPIPTLSAYIMDQNLNLLPVGVPGELCVGGEGVGRGYLNRPELTAEKFIPNPFADTMADIQFEDQFTFHTSPFKLHTSKLYRSGDLAKFLPNGDMEYLGRIDHQIKVRGFRIELGEIESQLLKHEAIKEVTVIAKEDPRTNSNYLCAYIVSAENLNVSGLKKHLSQTLPEYMIPAYFVTIEKMPLTSNGKIDRRSLPDPIEHIHTGVQYVAPSNDTERKLVELWNTVLGVENIGIEDNFFDLGGNSLLLIRVHSGLEEMFPGKVRITDLFTNSTIAKLACFIENQGMNREIRQMIKTVALPDDYFNKESATNDDALFKFYIDGALMEDIQKIALNETIGDTDLMFAIYIYLFAQITGAHEVVVQTSLEENNNAVSVDIDFSNIDRIRDLFNLTHQRAKAMERRYDITELKEMALKREDNAVLPLFAKKGSMGIKTGLLDLYDIVFEVFSENHRIAFTCEYNGKRLRKEKMREFVNLYLKLTRMVIRKYEEEKTAADSGRA